MVSFEKYLSFLSTTNKFVVEVIVEVLYNIEDNTSFFADSISFCSSLTWIDDNGGIYNGYIYKGKSTSGNEYTFFREFN